MAKAKHINPEAIPIVAAFGVLLSAIWVPALSFTISIVALVAFGFYKLAYH